MQGSAYVKWAFSTIEMLYFIIIVLNYMHAHLFSHTGVHAGCLWRWEPLTPSGAGVIGSCGSGVGAGNWTWVPYKSSILSYLLSPLLSFGRVDLRVVGAVRKDFTGKTTAFERTEVGGYWGTISWYLQKYCHMVSSERQGRGPRMLPALGLCQDFVGEAWQKQNGLWS